MKADSGQLNDITLKVTTTVVLFRFFDFSTSIGQVKVLIVSIVSERSISSWLKAKSYKLPQQAHTWDYASYHPRINPKIFCYVFFCSKKTRFSVYKVPRK